MKFVVTKIDFSYLFFFKKTLKSSFPGNGEFVNLRSFDREWHGYRLVKRIKSPTRGRIAFVELRPSKATAINLRLSAQRSVKVILRVFLN